MSDKDVYNKATEALRKAGFVLVRDGRHEIWKNGSKGIAISHNIRDRHRVNSLFRSAGIDARL